ncbi:MAG: PepSY-like domain-containing protein [Bacteroidota bacterium]
MKKSILFIAIGLITITANAQTVREHDVPTAVKQIFTDTYPKTEVEEWKIKNGNYQADFDYNKADVILLIDPKGHILQTGTEIRASELPANANAYISKNTSDKKVTEAFKIADAKGIITYEAEAGGENYFFDATGNFIKKEAEEAKK